MYLKKTISETKKSIFEILESVENKRKTILTYRKKGCKINNVSTYINIALRNGFYEK